MNYQTMSGTLTPEQMQMRALVEALRQPAQQQAAPAQQGQVVSAHPTGDNQPMYDNLGRLIGKGASYIGSLMAPPSSGPTYDTGV